MVKPGRSVGTRKQATPRCFFSGSVWAKIIATFALFPSEMNIFEPEIDQPPFLRVARVATDAASEPVPGSVSPKQPSHSPEQSLGRISCFCASVPHCSIDPATSEVCTDTTVRADESPRPISSTTRP